MSSQTQYSQTDLVFRFVGGRNNGCLVPVATSKCLLGKDQNNNAKCAVFRSNTGTTIKSLDPAVTLNGVTFDVAWLRQGDRLEIGNSVLEVEQLGYGKEAIEEQELPTESRDDLPMIAAQEEQILSPLDNVSNEIANELGQPATEPVAAPAARPATDPVAADPNIEENTFEDSTVEQPEAEETPIDAGKTLASNDAELDKADEDSPVAGESMSHEVPAAPETEQFTSQPEPQLGEDEEIISAPLPGSANFAAEDEVSDSADDSFDAESRPTSALEAYERLTNRLFEEETGDELVDPNSAASQLSAQLNQIIGDSSVAAAESGNHDSAEDGRPLDGVLPEGSLLEKFAVAEEETEEPESAPEPVRQESVAEVLARMQQQGDLESDYDESPEGGPDAEPAAEFGHADAVVAEQDVAPQAEVGQVESEGDDDSVQAYMNSLFQRLRGTDDPQKPEAPKANSDSAKEPSPVVEKHVASQPEVPVKLLTPDEFKPKAQAPERVVNLDAMRELANAQARSAIMVSQSKRRKAITLTCLVIVAFGLGMAGYCFATAKGLDVPFLVGSGCVLISCVAGYRCASAFLGWDLKVQQKTFGEDVVEQSAIVPGHPLHQAQLDQLAQQEQLAQQGQLAQQELQPSDAPQV